MVAPAGWGGRCGAEQREARRSHCRLRRRRELGSAARVAVLVGPGSLRGDQPPPRRALPWSCRCTPSVARKTRQWLVQFVHDFGALVWCQRCVGRIRGHRAVRMLRTSGRMSPGGPPTGTETSTFVLRVRACALVPACWWDRVHACAPGQARPWRPIHSQLNSVPLALGSTLLRHARRTRSQSRSSLTHPSLRRSARADPPAPPTVSAGASAVSERLRDCQADLTLLLWWHCSREGRAAGCGDRGGRTGHLA